MARKVFLVVITSSALIAFSGQSDAACQRSCTGLKNSCIKTGGNVAACSGGLADCLKSGTYAGMPSGRTWTNICKK